MNLVLDELLGDRGRWGGGGGGGVGGRKVHAEMRLAQALYYRSAHYTVQQNPLCPKSVLITEVPLHVTVHCHGGHPSLTSTAQMEHPLISTSSALPWGRCTPLRSFVISSLE